MFKIIRISIFLIIYQLTLSAILSDQWIISDSLENSNIRKIAAIDSQNCFYIGFVNDGVSNQYNFIRRTTNGGLSWKNVYKSNTFFNSNVLFYKEISYPSKNLIIVAADNGYVLKSSDNGESWHDKHIEEIDKHVLIDLHFKDNANGLILYISEKKNNDRVKLFKTNNSGDTWIRIELPDKYNYKTGHSIVSINLVNHNKLILFGNYFVDKKIQSTYSLLTYDDGQNWEKNIEPEFCINNYFINSDIGYAWGRNFLNNNDFVLKKTTDGGSSWRAVLDTGFNSNFNHSLHFINDQEGVLAISKDHIYRTQDGGKKYFMVIPEIDNDLILTDAVQASKNTIYALCMLPGYILKYIDFESSIIKGKTETPLHPNPATSHITLSLGEEFVSKPVIDIIDYLGNAFKPEYEINGSEITFNTSTLSPGVYFLRIRSGGQVETKKFVVVR